MEGSLLGVDNFSAKSTREVIDKQRTSQTPEAASTNGAADSRGLHEVQTTAYRSSHGHVKEDRLGHTIGRARVSGLGTCCL